MTRSGQQAFAANVTAESVLIPLLVDDPLWVIVLSFFALAFYLS